MIPALTLATASTVGKDLWLPASVKQVPLIPGRRLHQQFPFPRDYAPAVFQHKRFAMGNLRIAAGVCQ